MKYYDDASCAASLLKYKKNTFNSTRTLAASVTRYPKQGATAREIALDQATTRYFVWAKYTTNHSSNGCINKNVASQKAPIARDIVKNYKTSPRGYVSLVRYRMDVAHRGKKTTGSNNIGKTKNNRACYLLFSFTNTAAVFIQQPQQQRREQHTGYPR